MKFIRYFFVGGIAAVLNISIFYVFAVRLDLNYQAVSCASFVLATLLNYVLSIRHVFESGSRFTPRNELALVFVVSLIGLAVNQVVLYELISQFGMDKMLSQVIALFTVFVWNFAARNYFVFRKPGNG